MKIIFLDIDGVLCNRKSWINITDYYDGYDNFDNNCLRLLEKIVEETKAFIVVTSSWRVGKTTEKMKKIFLDRGFKYSEKIIDITPDLLNDCPSGWEIRKWLHCQKTESSFPVKQYVIIDDDIDMLYEQKDNFVETKTEIGLTEQDYNKAIKILNE